MLTKIKNYINAHKRQTEYTLSIGLNDCITGIQEISTSEAITIVTEAAYTICGGYTLTEASGAYNNNGIQTQENSLILTIRYTSKNQIIELIKTLNTALNQDSIMLTVNKVKSNYISIR